MRKRIDKHTKMFVILGFFIAYVILRIFATPLVSASDDAIPCLILRFLTGD